MLFNLENYWIFVALLAIIYVAITTTIQTRIGGKKNLKTIQEEMKNVQLQLMEASKKKDAAESDAIMKKYWDLTGDLMKAQFQMLGVLLVILFVFTSIFPHFEPGMEDDMKGALFDDGLLAHCDALASDGVFSNCFEIPANATVGAWTADIYLRSPSNETLARNAIALYVEGGLPGDVWLQTSSQTGLLDIVSGKKPYIIHLSTDKENYTRGDVAKIFAIQSERLFATSNSINGIKGALMNSNITLSKDENATIANFSKSDEKTMQIKIAGKNYHLQKNPTFSLFGDASDEVIGSVDVPPSDAKFEANINSGTFYYVDLPFTIPLINIRRIIGSYGVFLFAAFVISILYSIGKAGYMTATKKK